MTTQSKRLAQKYVRVATRLRVEKEKAKAEQTDWRSAHLRKGSDGRPYRLKRKGRVFIGEVYTPTGWRWVGELKPTTVKQSFVWDQPELKTYRQLVRIERVSGKDVFVVVPGLSPRDVFKVPRAIFPKSWRLVLLSKGNRFFAQVNMDESPQTGATLLHPPFEEASAPDPHDGLGPTTDPLKVINPGIPPTLRPEEIVEASADILELHTFIEKLISVMDGSATPSYASPLQKALRRCIRLRMLMQVADARLKASKAA